MAEQAAIEAKIEAVNRAEVERERLMKEQEAAERMAAMKEAEKMAMMEAEMMAMKEAEMMVAEEVAKEVRISSLKVLRYLLLSRNNGSEVVAIATTRIQFKWERHLPSS